MSEQLSFGEEPAFLSDPVTEIEKKFVRFHRLNPYVYRELTRRALEMVEVGVKHFGIALLYESMRYDRYVKTVGDEFKLNNNFKALYVRMLLAQFPVLVGRMRIRVRTTAIGVHRHYPMTL